MGVRLLKNKKHPYSRGQQIVLVIPIHRLNGKLATIVSHRLHYDGSGKVLYSLNIMDDELEDYSVEYHEDFCVAISTEPRYKLPDWF